MEHRFRSLTAQFFVVCWYAQKTQLKLHMLDVSIEKPDGFSIIGFFKSLKKGTVKR